MTKLTNPQREVLKVIRDLKYMPERTRGVGERLEEMGLVQNMYVGNVWFITEEGLAALGDARTLAELLA